MKEWKEYKISEIIEEIAMGPFGSNIKVDNFIEFGIPVLNGSNLQGFKLNEDSFNYVSEEKADSLGKANAFRGDVVITHRGTLGQIVYIPINSKHERYVISQSQFRLKLNQNIIRPDFFVYFFHTRIGQHLILMNASQVGVPALARPTSTFKEISIPIPPMEIQNKVMAILLSLDDKIELNRRINENLEQHAQALFKSWFVDFEPFKNGKFVDSELGMIPERWKVGQLLDFGKIICGKTPSKNIKDFFGGDIPFIKIPDMHNQLFIVNTEDSLSVEGSKTQQAKLLPPYSLLVSCIATVGLVAINTKPSHTNQQINSIVPQNRNSLYYLYLNLILMKKQLENMGRGGTTTLNINTTSFGKIRIIIPSNEVLDNFSYIATPLFKEIEILSKQVFELAHLRDTLLPKLMSGELKLSEIETK